MHTLEQVGDVA